MDLNSLATWEGTLHKSQLISANQPSCFSACQFLFSTTMRLPSRAPLPPQPLRTNSIGRSSLFVFNLLFLLFNPWDLYYRGHKNNNNNNNNNRALLSSLSLSILFIYISHITQDIFIISIKVHNNASTDLLPQLSTNVTQSFGTIKACCLKPTISQHFCYLSILYKTNSTYSDTSPHFWMHHMVMKIISNTEIHRLKSVQWQLTRK